MAGPDNPFASAEWSGEDSTALRAFLLTPTGRRLIFRLRADRPRFLPAGNVTVDQAAIFGSIASGYEEAVNNIFDYLVAPAPNPETDTAGPYPDLARDSSWPEDLQVAAFRASPPVQQNIPNEAEADMAAAHTNPTTDQL